MVHQLSVFSQGCCEFITSVSEAGLLASCVMEFLLYILAPLQMLSMYVTNSKRDSKQLCLTPDFIMNSLECSTIFPTVY